MGLIYPADGVLDDEYWKLVPPGVTVHITRVAVPSRRLSAERVVSECESKDIERSAGILSNVEPEVIAYCNTAGSFVRGAGHDEEIVSRIQRAGGVAATTAYTASVRALRALQVVRVAVATPYPDEINSRLRDFLEDSGFKVVALTGLRLREGIGSVASATSYRLARDADHLDAEALFVSCTNLRTVDIVETLEQDLRKPVVTANQATIWHSLVMAGVKPSSKGLGSLYDTKMHQ